MSRNIVVMGMKGAAIGVANVIPGVSGGTIALLLGIYHELAEAVGNILTAGWKQRLEYLRLLLPLFIGAALAILLFARLVEWLYGRYPEQLGFFFLGLIAASLPALIREMKERPQGLHWLLFLTGFALTLTLGILDKTAAIGADLSGTLPLLNLPYGIKLFFSGLLAATSMVVPGISGSFVMLLLGEYYHILGFINTMNIPVLLIFGIGTVLGLVGSARAIDIMLNRFFRGTMMFILGLVVASLYVVWPGMSLSPLPLMADLLALGAGAFMILKFARIA